MIRVFVAKRKIIFTRLEKSIISSIFAPAKRKRYLGRVVRRRSAKPYTAVRIRQVPHLYPHNTLKISSSFEDFFDGGLKTGLKMEIFK